MVTIQVARKSLAAWNRDYRTRTSHFLIYSNLWLSLNLWDDCFRNGKYSRRFRDGHRFLSFILLCYLNSYAGLISFQRTGRPADLGTSLRLPRHGICDAMGHVFRPVTIPCSWHPADPPRRRFPHFHPCLRPACYWLRLPVLQLRQATRQPQTLPISFADLDP